MYTSADGITKINVQLENETVWLTQKQLVDLFQTSKSTVSEHIKNIFSDEELIPEATVRKIRTVQKEGDREVTRELDDERLKNLGGAFYWKELLYRIREIRSSEKVMYSNITFLQFWPLDIK